jgi:hypothetical protein
MFINAWDQCTHESKEIFVDTIRPFLHEYPKLDFTLQITMVFHVHEKDPPRELQDLALTFPHRFRIMYQFDNGDDVFASVVV